MTILVQFVVEVVYIRPYFSLTHMNTHWMWYDVLRLKNSDNAEGNQARVELFIFNTASREGAMSELAT